MSGETHRDDDFDFDDDFVLEDVNDDLDDLFDDDDENEGIASLDQLFSAAAKPRAPRSPDADPDSDDVLFKAPSDQSASESFEVDKDFAESGGADWGGSAMEPEEIGIPIQAGSGEDSGAAEEQFGLLDEDPLSAYDDDFSVESEGEEFVLVSDDSELEGGTEPEEYGAEAEPDDGSTWAVMESADVAPTWQGETPSEQELPPTAPGQGLVFETDTADVQPVFQGEGQDEAAFEEEFAIGGGGQPEDADAEWTPAQEQFSLNAEEQEPSMDQDPIYGEQEVEYADGEQAHEGEQSWETQEYEDSYRDAAIPAEIAAARPRGRLLRFAAGLAAVLLVAGAGAVIVVKPELLGLKVEPQLVDRVEIARPTLNFDISPPELPVPVTDPVDPVVVTDPVDPVTVTDPVDPVVVTDPVDPVTVTDPVDPVVVTDPVDPVTVTDPVDPVVVTDPVDPVVVTDPVDPVTVTDPPPLDPGSALVTQPGVPVATQDPVAGTDRLPIGDDLVIGGRESESLRTLPDLGLTVGSNAFAQLKNGNFFIGSVKTLRAEEVTLSLDHGEITLVVADLQRITPLASTEFAELQKAQSGFVRLTNQNRLVGSILEGIADDHIILEMKEDRVLLPRAAVEEIGRTTEVGVRFSETDNDDEWLRKLIEGEQQPPEDAKQNPVRMRLPDKQ